MSETKSKARFTTGYLYNLIQEQQQDIAKLKHIVAMQHELLAYHNNAIIDICGRLGINIEDSTKTKTNEEKS